MSLTAALVVVADKRGGRRELVGVSSLVEWLLTAMGMGHGRMVLQVMRGEGVGPNHLVGKTVTVRMALSVITPGVGVRMGREHVSGCHSGGIGIVRAR